jgi:hypothetical protein
MTDGGSVVAAFILGGSNLENALAGAQPLSHCTLNDIRLTGPNDIPCLPFAKAQ